MDMERWRKFSTTNKVLPEDVRVKEEEIRISKDYSFKSR